MTIDLNDIIGKTLHMYAGSTEYQSGVITSVSESTLKLDRNSLASPIADLSTHIYNTSTTSPEAGWGISSYYDALYECRTDDIFSAVQTRSVWVSFNYHYRIYMKNGSGVFDIMPITYLLCYYTSGWIFPGISMNFILPNGKLFNEIVINGTQTEFTGTYSGKFTNDVFGDMYDGYYQLHACFSTYRAAIVKERPYRSSNPTDVYSILEITNIQFFNCSNEPISDGDKCRITNTTFSGTFT